MTYDTVGSHIVADFHGVKHITDNIDEIKIEIIEAAVLSGATVLSIDSHRAKNHSSVLCVLQESHIALYVFPNRVYLDAYTCGNVCDPELIFDYLLKYFNPKQVYRRKLIRGMGEIEIQ